MTDRFYILDCDLCGATLGWTTNGAFPSQGLTRCIKCARSGPMTDPATLTDRIADVLRRTVTVTEWEPIR